MYIAYLPKPAGEKVDKRKVNKFLQWYSAVTKDKYSIIAVPGYLSQAVSSIETYLQNLKEILAKKQKRKIGFLNGVNGHLSAAGGGIILDEHNKRLSTYNFDKIKLTPNNKIDHRKMMCFFEVKENKYDEITLDNLEEFLEDIYIGAILIGSSNQSKTTYFEPYAKKGEADIFMFDASEDFPKKNDKETEEEAVKRALLENHLDDSVLSILNDIVITKSFLGKGHEDTQEFFKSILRDILTNGLEK